MQKIGMKLLAISKKLAFYLILLIIWELTYRICVEILHIWKPYLFPSPIAVFKTLFEMIADNTIGIAVLASMKRIAIGYVISIIIGSIIGLLISRFKIIDENMSALILGLQTLPSICWLPFAILWFGLDESSIIFVIAIGSTFAISIAVSTSIKNLNPLYIRAAKTMGASGMRIYQHVILPASLPHLIPGMKQAWSFAWRGLIAGEMLSATKGLGQVLMMGRDLADINQVVVIMMIIVMLGLIVDKLVFSSVELRVRKKWGLDKE